MKIMRMNIWSASKAHRQKKSIPRSIGLTKGLGNVKEKKKNWLLISKDFKSETIQRPLKSQGLANNKKTILSTKPPPKSI